MAYIRRRGKGWQYTVNYINPLTGERKPIAKGGFRTKKEAQLAAAELERQLAQGTYIKESLIIFDEFSKEFIERYQSTGKVKISTVRVRTNEIGRFKPYFSGMKLKDISKKGYQEALNKMKTEEKTADNTLKGIHGTGKMFFKMARELDYISKDPTEFAYVPVSKKTVEELENEDFKVKYLEKEQLASFLKTAKEHGLSQDYLVFLLLSYTGMRAGELCALKWKDINFEEETISITKTYYNPTNNTLNYQLLTPKTKSSRRVITIDSLVINELLKHKREQKELILKYRKTYHDKDFVITKTDKLPGYPEIIKTIENRMRRLLKKCGLSETLTPHSLRHTHTSLLAEAGVELQDIMDRLGHKDDYTTKAVYLHVTKPKKKEASQKFAELMSGLSK